MAKNYLKKFKNEKQFLFLSNKSVKFYYLNFDDFYLLRGAMGVNSHSSN